MIRKEDAMHMLSHLCAHLQPRIDMDITCVCVYVLKTKKTSSFVKCN